MSKARIAALAIAAGVSWLSLAAGARAQDDDSELFVRTNRLEGQLRQLSGQVEQLQFDNRQLKDQLRKFQEDVEFRFGEKGGGARPSASPAPATTPPAASPTTARPARRSDAFDPDTPAPGAPRPLGSAAPSGPIVAESAPPATRRPPRNEDSAFAESYGGSSPGGGSPELAATARSGGTLNPGLPGGRTASAAPSVAAAGSDDARADYESAAALVAQKQYDGAEMALRRFIQSHPRDRRVPDATYSLGETYLGRNRPREAAEQFLKVSTEFSKSGRAPEALLKLGVSLSALGAKDQACATFAELERKFPTAGASVKQGVEREQKRARCPT